MENFKKTLKKISDIMFLPVIIINTSFYLFSPVIALLIPVDTFFQLLSFALRYIVPLLTLLCLIIIFIRPKRTFLLWSFIIINIIVFYFAWHLFKPMAEPKDIFVPAPLTILTKPKIVEAATRPNDPQWATTTDLYRWGQEFIKLPEAWDIETGKNTVKIGVIDTGFDIFHEDLKDNIDSSISPQPIDEHGTSVAGIIGAKGNNATGIAGTMWDAGFKV